MVVVVGGVVVVGVAVGGKFGGLVCRRLVVHKGVEELLARVVGFRTMGVVVVRSRVRSRVGDKRWTLVLIG